jgi:mannose-6-phosphate isomerase
LRLIEFAEQHGVRDGVALNAILDDGQVHDGTARLWGQTERLKAALRAAHVTGEARYWAMAESAVRTLQRFLETPVSGLWYDRLTPGNEFVNEPAPASSFYHIVCAAREMQALVPSTAGRERALT